MPKQKSKTCPSCNSSGLEIFYEANNVPVNSCLMFSSREEAIAYPRGDVNLAFCNTCGFITNTTFEPSKINYSMLTPEEQGSSATFNAFADRLANRLIQTYKITGKKILEIGCGRGDFLALLCRLGKNQGVGIDPSIITGQLAHPLPDDLVFFRDYFSEKYAAYIGDLVVCRHTLEHIHNTAEFLHDLRKSIGRKLQTVNFFEVPDVTRIMKEVAFWDIYYEHCSYFTLGSLARLFRLCNFDVKYLAKDYFDQYLLVDSTPVEEKSTEVLDNEENVELTAKNVAEFSDGSDRKLGNWKDTIKRIKKEKEKAVIWGSGSKCVGFVTTLGVKDEVGFIVDINPLRHRKFIPGVGIQIMPPEFLKAYKPDVVIIMNPVYLNEIKSDLSRMDLSPEIIPCS